MYCEFKAGVFAALRLHMIRILKTDFYGKIVKNPKIQTNGTGKNEAETRKIVNMYLLRLDLGTFHKKNTPDILPIHEKLKSQNNSNFRYNISNKKETSDLF